MVRNKNSIVLIGIFITCLFSIIIKHLSFVRTPNQRNTKTFIVGTAAGYAPYVSINSAGNYEGFDVDVANKLAQKMDVSLELKDLGSMTSLMMALEQGSIDAIIWGISITQARQKKFALIHYQGAPTTEYPLIFWKKIPETITNLENMKGLTICAEPSSSQYDVLKSYPDIQILPIDKVDDALLHIQHGTAIAALLDPAIANKYKAKFPEIQILAVPLAQENQVHGIGIVIAKGNTQLQEQVQQAVDVLKNDGTINALEMQWGLK